MTHAIARRSALTLMAALGLAPAARAAPAKKAMPEVTIYHLEGRRSERVVWLMEELGLPYRLEFKRGDLAGSMAQIRALSPIVPMAPTVRYGDQVLVESGAILQLIVERHGGGRMAPPPLSADYATHLMWMHYAEGSLASRLFSDYRAWMAAPPTRRSPLVDSEAVVQFADEHLKAKPWFGGAQFTAADIMMAFPLNVATALNIVDAAQFPAVAAWKAKVEARPAFARMRAKALPDGKMPGMLPVLPKHAPSGPRP